jgi:hypothetical protein
MSTELIDLNDAFQNVLSIEVPKPDFDETQGFSEGIGSKYHDDYVKNVMQQHAKEQNKNISMEPQRIGPLYLFPSATPGIQILIFNMRPCY